MSSSTQECIDCGASFRMYEADSESGKVLQGTCPQCGKWLIYSLTPKKEDDIIIVPIEGYIVEYYGDEGEYGRAYFSLSEQKEMDIYIADQEAYGASCRILPVATDDAPFHTKDDIAEGRVKYVKVTEMEVKQ